jgi:hypothetical protein
MLDGRISAGKRVANSTKNEPPGARWPLQEAEDYSYLNGAKTVGKPLPANRALMRGGCWQPAAALRWLRSPFGYAGTAAA